MRYALILLFACGHKSSGSTTAIKPDAATPLQIVVLDDYGSKDTCENVPPRKVEVMFDGKSAGIVEVPCRTKTVMPPPQFPGATVTLAAGKHAVVAREIGVGNSVEKEIELPVILNSFEDGTDELATKLPIFVRDDELDIAAPKVKITFEGTPPE